MSGSRSSGRLKVVGVSREASDEVASLGQVEICQVGGWGWVGKWAVIDEVGRGCLGDVLFFW